MINSNPCTHLSKHLYELTVCFSIASPIYIGPTLSYVLIERIKTKSINIRYSGSFILNCSRIGFITFTLFDLLTMNAILIEIAHY